MAKADLHVHSKYSDYPSTWGHKAYNSPESFTETETVYQQAKSRGMDFVTLTDHDDIRGSLELVQNHPLDCFVSCEVTSYFPEDNCKVHILVYGITQQQHEQMQSIAKDLYQLRDYIIQEHIAYSVAHATYDQDGKLQFEHIEKLVLLFDVFEIINGGADAQAHLLLNGYLQNLEEPGMEQLREKHNIKPLSADPWVKGFTGGSDDHCGILIGTAYTQSACQTVDEFLEAIRNKKSLGNGLHGSFESYATGVIKHIHDFRLDRDPEYRNSKMNDFLELFFDGRGGNLLKRFKKSQSLRYLKKKNTKTHKALHNLLTQISNNATHDVSTKISSTYLQVTELHDEMFRSVVTAFAKHFPEGDIFKGLNRLATLFPMTLLAAPFIGSLRHQVIKSGIRKGLIEGTRQHYTEKALWFTDTIDDLNGVSITLYQIAEHGVKHGYQLKLVTCVDEGSIQTPLPANTLNFHPVKEVRIPGYETQSVGFPSLLTMLRKMVHEQPDQIIISTPGPLGAGAMLCAKLMDLPVKTVYHTDFAEQLLRMTGEPMLANLTDLVVNAFYKQADQVFVPSKFYIDKLTQAGFIRKKLEIFPRGLDLDLYRPKPDPSNLTRRHQLHGQFTLLYAGRISKDKNLSLLTRIFKQLNQQKPGLYNLIVAGDGPDMASLQVSLGTENNVLLTGRLEPQELVGWYQSVDLLVFPSHTDTFGMVVLEAQACGLPCLVTATGGPREIIKVNHTGQVIHTGESRDWIAVINDYRKIKQSRPEEWAQLKVSCAEHVHQQNNWQPVFDAVLGNQCRLPAPCTKRISPESGPTLPDSPLNDNIKAA